MATRTKYMTLFTNWGSAAIAHEVKSRGLGEEFHRAVCVMLTEEAGKTNDELVDLFRGVINELENSLIKELEEHFGDGATLSKEVPAFKQYKSDYLAALKLLGYEVKRYSGPYQVKQAKIEANKAANEGGDPDGGGAPALASMTKLPKEVRAKLESAIRNLMQLPEDEVTRIAENFEGVTWAALRKAKPKLGAIHNAAAADAAKDAAATS